jgi:hypothetical protein
MSVKVGAGLARKNSLVQPKVPIIKWLFFQNIQGFATAKIGADSSPDLRPWKPRRIGSSEPRLSATLALRVPNKVLATRLIVGNGLREAVQCNGPHFDARNILAQSVNCLLQMPIDFGCRRIARLHCRHSHPRPTESGVEGPLYLLTA